MRNRKRGGLVLRDTLVFAMLGTIMFLSKLVMEGLPNVHLIGVLTVVYTAVYRSRALYPVYVFVFLTGLYGGFNLWWIPYLYLWPVLWGAAMLVPRRFPIWAQTICYMAVCAAHGFLYGTLYAPAQAIMFGFTFKQTIAWIVAGLPWDAVHGFGNLALSVLIMPLVLVMRKLDKVGRAKDPLPSAAPQTIPKTGTLPEGKKAEDGKPTDTEAPLPPRADE